MRILGSEGSTLDETPSSTFGIDPLETFLLLPHVDHTKRGKEETKDDGHESIDGREDVVQGYVCKFGDRSDTEKRGVIDVGRVKGVNEADLGRITKRGRLYEVSSIEVATATELVLYKLSSCVWHLGVNFMEVVAFSQGEDPDESSNDDDCDGAQDEKVIKNNETNRNMIALNDGSDRE